MTKPDHSKTINILMFIALLLVCGAFGLFIILNWKYISNPDVHFRNVFSEAIFAYSREDSAIMRYWGFYYPWVVICFLIYLQSVMMTYLLIKKNLGISRNHWIVLICVLIVFLFLPTILDYLADLLQSKILNNLEFDISDFITAGLMILTVVIFIISIILFFLKRFKSYRQFLALSFFTVVMNLVFTYSFMELFFD